MQGTEAAPSPLPALPLGQHSEREDLAEGGKGRRLRTLSVGHREQVAPRLSFVVLGTKPGWELGEECPLPGWAVGACWPGISLLAPELKPAHLKSPRKSRRKG